VTSHGGLLRPNRIIELQLSQPRAFCRRGPISSTRAWSWADLCSFLNRVSTVSRLVEASTAPLACPECKQQTLSTTTFVLSLLLLRVRCRKCKAVFRPLSLRGSAHGRTLLACSWHFDLACDAEILCAGIPALGLIFTDAKLPLPDS
jgi:prepilin signal peptidase PulO-like enzyme (type II secretory pathway)